MTPTTLNDFIEKKEREFAEHVDTHDEFAFLRSALHECAEIAADKGAQTVTRFGVTKEGQEWLNAWLGTNDQPHA